MNVPVFTKYTIEFYRIGSLSGSHFYVLISFEEIFAFTFSQFAFNDFNSVCVCQFGIYLRIACVFGFFNLKLFQRLSFSIALARLLSLTLVIFSIVSTCGHEHAYMNMCARAFIRCLTCFLAFYNYLVCSLNSKKLAKQAHTNLLILFFFSLLLLLIFDLLLRQFICLFIYLVSFNE